MVALMVETFVLNHYQCLNIWRAPCIANEVTLEVHSSVLPTLPIDAPSIPADGEFVLQVAGLYGFFDLDLLGAESLTRPLKPH